MTTPALPQSTLDAAKALAEANVDDIGLAVFALHPGDQGAPTAHSVPLTTDAAAEVILRARDYIGDVLGNVLVPYGASITVPSGHSLYLAQDRAANLNATEDALAAGNYDTFDSKAPYARKVNLLAFRLSLGSGATLTLYRVLKPMFRFGKGLMSLLLQDGQYTRLDPADVLTFDLDFDVLVANGTAIFNLKTTFERVFGFLEELRKNAKKTFKKVTKELKIKGAAELEKACATDIGMMNKMAAIARSIEEDSGYAKAMTMAKLVAFVTARPTLGIEVEGAGANAQLVYEGGQKRFKLLNLLDDDYLHSGLTERDYEALSKNRTPAKA